MLSIDSSTEQKKVVDQPIYYAKEVIKNEGDILKHINFDSDLIETDERQKFNSYQEYKDFLEKNGIESYIKFQQQKLPGDDRRSEIRKDVEYEKLINRIRPDVKYYDQSRGD